MKKQYLSILGCLLSLAAPTWAQDLHSDVQTMQKSYAASGSIVIVDDHTLMIEPKMPGPVCALPKTENGKTTWSYYAFPLSSITVSLAEVDDTLIGEDRVFTTPEAAKGYKPGDTGDATMIVLVGIPGKQFHTLTYDREKLANLGPGPHNSSAYNQAPDDVMAFGLTFTDEQAARSFVSALRNAIQLARHETVAAAQTAQ
jgi:hypothetical protein